jgi:TolA-binding protein
MITPKIEEIEKKFTSNQGLNQEDINTLLLKSQYNHINHLDDKLNEVASSVISLEHKFELLNEKIQHTIQKALNKNMFALISVMGAFLILSKIIDKF